MYQLRTLPFGATHSVYSFLRLARMLCTICTREFFLLTTNFYDDYILASLPNSVESSKNSMELVFMLTGWKFDMDGKKATSFGTVCKALGVQFDLSSSSILAYLGFARLECNAIYTSCDKLASPCSVTTMYFRCATPDIFHTVSTFCQVLESVFWQ